MKERTQGRVTISDVARAAGVSPTTVSHALSGRGQVEARTRERVLRVARELRYRPNRHAQRLRTGEAHMIVLLSSMPFARACFHLAAAAQRVRHGGRRDAGRTRHVADRHPPLRPLLHRLSTRPRSSAIASGIP